MITGKKSSVERRRKLKAFLSALAGAGVVGGVVMMIKNRRQNSGADESANTSSPIKLLARNNRTAKTGQEKQNSSASSNALPAVFNAPQMAEDLYKYARSENIAGVIFVLRQITNTSEYSSISEEFKKVTGTYTLVRYTLVNGLLDKFFVSNASAKDQIKAEFKRIGLKLDYTSGKWSLSGFSLHKDIITIAPTYVKDWMGNRILVKSKTILGDEKAVINGSTWFTGIDGKTYQVPTRDVKYL